MSRPWILKIMQFPILAGFLLAPVATVPALAVDMSEPTEAQPELQKQALTVIARGGIRHDFSVELARTSREQQVGLMFRQHIPDNGGMLFIWPAPQESEMWMENCPVPEDMLFVDADGVIRNIAENTVPQSLAHIPSGGPVKATIELQGGITAKLGIRVGDRIESKAFDQARQSAQPGG